LYISVCDYKIKLPGCMHDHVSLNPVGPIGLCSLLVAKAYGAASICITGKHQHTVSISNNLRVFLYVESFKPRFESIQSNIYETF
jgi:hypothetical protein